MMGIKAVGVAWLSKRSIFLLLALQVSSKLLAEEIKATSIHSNSNTCNTLSRGPSADLNTLAPELQTILSTLIQKIENKDPQGFKKLFHPRARVKRDIGDRIFSILSNRYGKKWDVSIFRVWLLHSALKDKTPFDCKYTDGFKPVSRYGYQNQFFSILQVLGESELGRIIVTTAETAKGMVITGFQIQQWTHQGRDWVYWTEKGNKYLNNNKPLNAYKSYDVAQKLLQAGDFIIYEYLPDILKTRDSIYTQVELVDKAKKTFKRDDFAYIGTTLNQEGTGLIIRLRLQKELATDKLQTQCQNLGKAMLKNQWLNKGDGGIKCSFLLPHESPDKDGKLGGLYYTQDDLKPL